MYDQGTVANALGAYAGERQPDAKPQLSEAGIGHIARNAMFLVRGRYYVRAVGSDENEVVMAQLRHLEKVLDASLPGEALPWGYAVFAGQMGMDPGKISFTPENAYSFGFAGNVFSVQLDDDGAELFATATESASAATELAAQFTAGFASYGDGEKGPDGVTWVTDQYLGNVSGVRAVRSMVIGVYSAADAGVARSQLARLAEVVAALPEEMLQRAAAAASKPSGGGYGEAEPDDESADAEPESEGAGEDSYGAEPDSEPGAEPEEEM
jgi:hypothetical protein